MSLNPFAAPRCEKCGHRKGRDVRPDPKVLNEHGHPTALCNSCWFSTRPTYEGDRGRRER